MLHFILKQLVIKGNPVCSLQLFLVEAVLALMMSAMRMTGKGLRITSTISGSIGGSRAISRCFGVAGFSRKKSYYEILDVKEEATTKEIKKAFMKKGSSAGLTA